VSQLSTDEKIGIVSGAYRQPGPSCIGQIGAIPRLNFTGVCYADGPAGFGRSDGVSVFSSGLATAATWDTDLIYERGVALGEEFRGKGAHVHLGYVDYPRTTETTKTPRSTLIISQTNDRCDGASRTGWPQLGRVWTGSLSRWTRYERHRIGHRICWRSNLQQALRR
jgi:hypothetical protein